MYRIAFVLVFMLFNSQAWSKKLNGFDVSNSLIPVKDIVQGGPPRDGIPAIFHPHYVTVQEATFMRPDDIVLGLEFEGEVFAFARHILNWHELVNDNVKGNPFLVSYCPLCGSGMAFSSSVSNEHLTFGVSGLLYNNDLVFYDKQSESLWSQIERRAISGKYVGTELKQIHLHHTTWSNWSKLHPNTKVLSENQGIKRNYRHDPYSGYETSSRLFFKTLRETPNEFHTKEKVLGIELGQLQKCYPYTELRKRGMKHFEDKIGDTVYRILWDEEHEFARIETLQGEPVVTSTMYWFAWYNFHPDSIIFRHSEK